MNMRNSLWTILLITIGSAQANTICTDADFVNTCGNGTIETAVLRDSRLLISFNFEHVGGGDADFDGLGRAIIERTDHVNGGLYNGSVNTEITDYVAYIGGAISEFRLGVDRGVAATTGAIQQTGAGTADSSFNMFFEANSVFGTLHNNDALFLEAEISQIPGFGTVYSFDGSIDVYDDSNIVQGKLSRFRMVVTPIPAAVWLFGSALAGLGWVRRKQSA
jgi:hypothetical protein